MKKITIMVLTVAVLLSSSFTYAFASEVYYQKETELSNIALREDKSLGSGIYSLQIHENQCLSFGRRDIDLTDGEDVANALNDDRISAEVKATIEEMHQKAEAGYGATSCSLYSPELLAPNDVALASTSTSAYYYYNGTRMRTDLLYTYGASTRSEDIMGSRTKTIAGTLVNLALNYGGGNRYVAILSNAQTVLSAFTDVYGSSYAIGTTEDFLELGISYDDVKQWTYREYTTDNWRLGYCSQFVTLTQIDTRQHYSNGSVGKTVVSSNPINLEYKSSNFDSPWATAYANINNPISEWVSCSYAGLNFLL